MMKLLLSGEMVIADVGYCTNVFVKSQTVLLTEGTLHVQLLLQEEVCNAKLKYFNISPDVFMHFIFLNWNTFHVVYRVEYIAMAFEERLLAGSTTK